MPVVPVMAAIGGALGASAGTAAAVGTMATLTAVSVGAQGYAMVKQNQANKASARLATDTASYNQLVNETNATQTEMDADASTRAARRDAQVYTSRQKAAYAASGVLNSGSALAAQVETAGRMEQQILQSRSNSLREAEKMRAAGRMGILYGNAQADAIKRQNSIDMLRGGVGILSTVGSFYQAGMFAGMGAGGANTRAGMLAAGAPAGLAARSGL